MEREARPPVFIDYKSPAVIQCVCPALAGLASDRVVQSIGAGRTDLLTSLFHERGPGPTSPLPQVAPQPGAAPGKQEWQSAMPATPQQGDREIVDILLAADLAGEMEEAGEGYVELYDDVNNSNIDNINSNLVPKPKKKLELKAGLLKEILSNKQKRHTFSGLYM